jgi:tetratricopeptide (TPR) repeat protein
VAAPPATTYYFTHLLTRDAAYRAQLRHNRQTLHSAAADALAAELVPGGQDERERLALLQHHLAAAGRWREAHERCCAGLRSRAQQGYTRDWEEHAAVARELWAQARSADPALPEEPAVEHATWAFYLSVCGRHAEALARAARGLELAAEQGDALQLAFARGTQGMLLLQARQLEAALAELRGSLAVFRELGHLQGEMRMMNNLALGLVHSKSPAEGIAMLQAGLALAQRSGNLLYQANFELNLGFALDNAGQAAAAQEHNERALELALQLGDLQTEGAALTNLGDMARQAGDWPRARALLQRGLALGREIRMPDLALHCLGGLARIELMAGEPGLARELVDAARPYVAAQADPRLPCALALLAAEVELAAGSVEAAGTQLAAARALLANPELAGSEELQAQLAALEERLAGGG